MKTIVSGFRNEKLVVDQIFSFAAITRANKSRTKTKNY